MLGRVGDEPSSARMRKAMGESIEVVSLLIHELERGAQGRCKQPGLPGADGDGERPVLLAQALLMPFHGDAATEPAGASRLARLPLQGQPGVRQMESDYKGVAPYPDGRLDLPRLGYMESHPLS